MFMLQGSAGVTGNNAGRDHREFIFFILLAVFIFIKFYCLELTISPVLTRYALSAAASAGIIALMLAAVSLLWYRIRPYAALILDFLLSALVVTDLMYMRYYSDLFTIGNLGLSSQVSDISESVAALFSLTDILYFLDIPLLLLGLFIVRNLRSGVIFKKLTLKRFAFSMILIAAGGLFLGLRILNYQKNMPGVLCSMWDRPAVCNNIGALTYHAVDAWNVTGDGYRRRHVPAGEADNISDWFLKREARNNTERYYGSAKGKNLIIIQVESLQQFVVGLKINGKEVTPNLNRFIRGSVYFNRAYNQTAAGNSADAEFLANAGLYPSPSGVAYIRFAGNTYDALPKFLSGKGYSTLALHGDRPGFWNRQHMYPALGFQRFISKLDFNVDENIGMGLSDRSFFRQSLSVLSRERQPFYAFLVTLTSHYPFNFDGIAEQAPIDVRPFNAMLMGDYLRSMKYFDTQFGMFIDGLKKNGLLDKSVVIVYGDHTAIPRWDSQDLEKLLSKKLSDDWSWREVQKIPLIIRIPGSDKAQGVKLGMAAGLVDVPNTAAALLGFRFPMGFGTDLFSANNDEPVIFRNGSYITGRAFVEPSGKRAVDLTDGKVLDFTKFDETSYNVEKRLAYSDCVLEHDLIAKILDKRSVGK